ncbi:F-box protein SKIP22-like [Rutidosis leptorrhynchoides]|uniref:F-box protein SKIP22-like n=1 Tax=Rutidosis leptorrhynchoides TaxID=125765 RepID=UPI003A99EC06
MKLRLRSFETKETLKLEIPNPCTLQHLKELVCQKLPSSSSPAALHLSLNQKDELTITSPEDSIQSIGITSGDLIYFTTNPIGFFTGPQLHSVTPSQPTSAKSHTSQTLIPKKDEAINTSSEKVNTVDNSNSNSEEIMEIDDDVPSVNEVDKSFSVPSFLRKVFTEELGDDDGLNHKLLVIAVRAVLLESGFVEVGPASNDLQGNLYLASFYYTLPNIVTNGDIETVKIKFQSVGKYCTVYGSLVNGTGTHSVMLDEEKLVPFLNVVWANCGLVVATMEENNKVLSVEPEKEVFEFWRKMKDGLALPLLIDLCEKAGFELPPCLMRLPTELKLKILESVSGVDIAKVSCTCSELRYLGSSDDLWKRKYIEEFGDMGGSDGGRTYKERFVKTWEGRKRRKIAVGRSGMSMMRRRNRYGPFGTGQFPGMIGGDYDLFPNLGPFGVPRGGGPRMRNVTPNCNLGGLNH